MNLEIVRKLSENRGGGLKKLAADVGMSEQNLHRCIRNNKIQAADLEKIAFLLKADIRIFFDDEVSRLSNNTVETNGDFSPASMMGNVSVGTDAILVERVKHLEELLAEKERLIKVYEKLVEGKKMRYIVGIICLITSLLLCACSEDDEKGAERYSGVFLSMEAIDAITPEDSFSDVILHNVEFEKVEVGKGEPIEAGDYTVKTETTYDLIMQESEADLYIKTEKRTDKMFEATYVYKYVFKQGTYGVIEVSENAITVNGYPYCKLQKFTLIRTEPIGEKYSKQDTETENYKGVFSCKSNGRSITLSNSDYMFEAALDGNECRLTELSPEHKNIGTLEKQ